MRIIEVLTPAEARAELKKIGTDPEGIKIMAPKLVFRTIKIKSLRSVAANILKQEMLSIGGEAAVSWGAVNLSKKTTDVILSGSLKHFSQLAKKLKAHSFGLPALAEELRTTLTHYETHLAPAYRKTQIMGILNVTPDSFYDGGRFLDIDLAVSRARELKAAGADIIDIGGESTRPGAKPVPVKEEIKRVVPVIKRIKTLGVPISIDTRRAAVAETAIRAGASLINDISGLKHDPKMAYVAARHRVPVVLMHMKGTPRTMQKDPRYQDLMEEIIEGLSQSIEIALKAGISRDKLILDPGFGFGKTAEHNLEILRRLRELKILGIPLLIGTSRKSTIGKVLNLPAPSRLLGTAATAAIAILNGADIIRVHDVPEMKQIAKMTDSVVRRKAK